MTRVLLAAFLALVPAGLSAHGEADWIMRGPNSSCCGPTDCHEIEHSDVRHETRAGGEGVYIVAWRGAVHETPERQAKRSERPRPWVCENPDHSIRCLFVLPMGA